MKPIKLITHESWDALYALQKYLDKERPCHLFSGRIERNGDSSLWCDGYEGIAGGIEVCHENLLELEMICQTFMAGYEAAQEHMRELQDVEL